LDILFFWRPIGLSKEIDIIAQNTLAVVEVKLAPPWSLVCHKIL
jgi:hypothetical protein